MPNSGDELRLKLFRLYSQNLSIHVPGVSGIFVCPVCARTFRESDVLHGETLKVDVGHVYPAAAGGNLFTLECCECNRRLNRDADNELVKLHNQWDAMQPASAAPPMKGYIEMPSGRVGIDFGAAGIHAHWTRAHPQAFAEALQALINRTPMSIVTPATRQGKLNLAILHSAHLLLFRAFAYGYLFTPAGQYVRNIVENSSDLDDAPYMTIEFPNGGKVDEAILYRCGVCTCSNGDRCLFVALPVPDPRSTCQLVLLPGPWANDLEAFKRFTAVGERWLQANYQTVDEGPWQRLTAREYADCLHLLWKGWQQHNIDMTKIMYAVWAQVGGDDRRKADAAQIAARFGIAEGYLARCIQSLATRGFLERAPKRCHPHLVRLTPKSIDDFKARLTD